MAGTMTDEDLRELTSCLATGPTLLGHLGIEVESVEPGRTVFAIDLAEPHMNGVGVVHGGVHATLIDTAMGIAIVSLGLRAATSQMNVHYLEAVEGGRIRCRGRVVHRSGRTATAEGRVYDEDDDLIAIGTGAFRVFGALEPDGP